MAVTYWTGNQRATARSHTFTVNTVTAGDTLTATINSKVETYTIPSSPTTASVAAGLVALLATSPVRELANFTFTSDSNTVRAVGPADGRPLTISFAATGTSTISSVTSVAATSPHDADDAANYLGGTKPGNGDTLIFENNSVDCLYNLAEFTSNTVTFVKRASYGGIIGLPDTNPLGYPEYLPTHFETAGTSLTVEDNGVVCRIESTAGSATTATVTGPGGGTLNAETVEITGLPASSVVNVNGGTLALAPLTNQAAAVGTARIANGVLRTGPSAVLGTATIIDSQAELAGNYTALTVDGDSDVLVTRAATAATSTTLDGGVTRWGSTGGPNTTTVGTGAELTFAPAPAAVTVGTITLEAGSTLRDPYERMAKTFNLTVNCKVEEVTLDLGTRFSLAVS